MIFLFELKENIRLGKITDERLIKKASDNTFEISDIKEYLDNLKKYGVKLNISEEFETKNEIIKSNYDVKRKFVSNKSITPDEFKRLIGVNALPTTNRENLILREYGISCVVYDNCEFDSINLSYTNAKINPQKIMSKKIKNCNLEGVDLSNADFTDLWLIGTNLKDTRAKIDPQKLYDKSIKNCNLKGLDLSDADFTDVDIVGSSLKNASAKIDPQKVKDRYIGYCNLEGLDLNSANFTDVLIQKANLKDTRTKIDPQKNWGKI